MNIQDMDTPALVLDADILDRNLRRMADYARQHGLRLRPHTKTHKMPSIARLQVQHGSSGITVAKLGEAEVMADAGIDDILIVYPLWGDAKWSRAASLAGRVRLSVAVDSLAVAAGLSRAAIGVGATIGIRLEFDTGFRRCGLPIDEGSLNTALRIMDLPGLRWEGISVYPGHIMGDVQSRTRDIEQESAKLDHLYELLDSAQVPYAVVSGGNTPAAYESHLFHGVNEIRPGTYVFNDRNTVDAEAATFADCALTVLTTVVSTSVQGRAIVDAGSKTLSADALLSGKRGQYGYILGYPELLIEDLSEEHGHILLPQGASIHCGEQLRIVPNHVCPCVNLHDRVFVVSGEHVVDEWRVAARGKSA